MTRFNDPKLSLQNHATDLLIQLHGTKMVPKSRHVGSQKVGTNKNCGISFAFQAYYFVSRCQHCSGQLAKTPHMRHTSFSSSLPASIQEVLCSIFLYNANTTKIWTDVNTPGKPSQSGTTKHWRKLRPPLV